MSEVTEKLDSYLTAQQPRTFEAWLQSNTDEDQAAILEALEYAYNTRHYSEMYRVLSNLSRNPVTVKKDAMINYAKARFDLH